MKDIIVSIIKKVLNKLEINYEEKIEVNIPKLKENGDYSTNIALKLVKKLNKNPIEIANLLKENIDCEQINKIEIKNPGFINFFVNKNYLVENLKKVLNEKENYGRNNIRKNKKINIEFVSANTTGI